MSRVCIVGGGLTGILAAFQAHRLGVDQIELHERFDQLGGVALPEQRHGLEMREGCIYFGPPGDPIRNLLETYGQSFTDFDNRFGSVSPGGVSVEDFGGPALPGADILLTAPTGPSLAERLIAYPPAVGEALARYARWHLDCDLGEVHGSAAIPLAINRVFPRDADLAALADAKRADPLADELFAIPRTQWGRTANLTASLPTDGFPAFLRRTRRALERIGVTIHDRSLVSPRQALAEHRPGDTLVWAANPTPLFKAAGVPTPKLLPKSFVTHVFAARWTGALPFYIQNFTAQGVCFRVYVYESAGRTLLTAECVAEAGPEAVAAEVARLLAGFEGKLELGERLATAIKPRWIYHSTDATERLSDLQAAMFERMGPDFVGGAWAPYSKTEKFREVNAGLAAALAPRARSAAVA